MKDIAKAAKALLEEDLIQDAFELIENNLIEQYKNLQPSDRDALELVKLQHHALQEIKRYLRGLAQSADIEET